MHNKRTDTKLAEGLWRVCFLGKKGLLTWIIFIDDPRKMAVIELNKFPRLHKGKNQRQVFEKLGIGYPKKKRQQKKIIMKYTPA